jgi:DNA-binding protein WhiA
VEAAQEQLSAIRTLHEKGLFENLPPKLRSAAIAREQAPEASLSELAQMMEPPISKPAMNNRMKKLIQTAKEATA